MWILKFYKKSFISSSNIQRIQQNPVYFDVLHSVVRFGSGGGDTPYNGLYGEAPPERGSFFRLQVYERVGISPVEVYEMVGKCVTWSVKWPKKATEGSFMSVKSSKTFSGFVQWFIRLQQLKEMQSFKLRMTEGGNICQWKEYERGTFSDRNVI